MSGEDWVDLFAWLRASGLTCSEIRNAVEYWQCQLPLFPEEEENAPRN